MKEQNLPVIDDENFRQKQMERFVAGVETVGDYFGEMKNYQKNNHRMTIFYLIMMVVIIGGIFVYGYAKGGLFGLIDENAPIRKIDCSNELYNDTVRTYEDATKFVELFGGGCQLRLSKD